MTALTFTVPLPFSALSPNPPKHWRTKMGPTKAYRLAVSQLATAAMREQCFTPSPRTRLHLQFRVKQDLQSRGRYHPTDADNALASAKALIDGLRDAGVISGDRADQLEIAPVTVLRLTPAEVVVTVEPLEASDGE